MSEAAQVNPSIPSNPPSQQPPTPSPFEQALTTGEVTVGEVKRVAGETPPAVDATTTAPTPPSATEVKKPVNDGPKLPTIGKKTDQPADKVELFSDEPPKDFSPKAAESWKAAKAKWQAQYQEAEAKWTKEREELSKKQSMPADYEQIKKEYGTYKAELERIALERTPEFKKHYEDRFSQADALARSAVPKEKAELVSKLLKISDLDGVESQLEAVAAELTPLQAGKLATAIQQYQAAKLDREAKLADSASQLKFAEEHSIKLQQQQQQEHQRQVETITKEVLELANGLNAFQKIEGNKEHNDAIPERIEAVKSLLNNNAPEELTRWAAPLAVEAIYLKNSLIPSLQAEVKQMKETIAAYTKGTPRTDGGASTTQQTSGGKDFWSVLGVGSQAA